MKIKLFLAALVLTAAAAPAYAASSVCLRHSEVDGWGARDKHSMVVNDRFGRKYLVTLNGLCDDLNYSFGMGFRALGGMNVGTCVERGDRIVMRGGGASMVGNDTCWVQKVQPYTKDMEQADKLAKQNHQPLNAY
jgi:hypothetical protein